MMKFKHIILFLLSAMCWIACSDEDDFTTSTGAVLTFSVDSVQLDTAFSNVPTAMKSLWVYNRGDKGVRISQVRLEHGNQTGFRVNVDGTYLGSLAGFQTSDVEVRGGDSIRVFVELTAPYNYSDVPQVIDDNLIFTLQSGVRQKVNLRGYSWDATLVRDCHVKNDTVFDGTKPLVFYGGLVVDSGATLTVKPGVTLYFHDDKPLEVYGKLIAQGTPDNEVVFRGDRIDRMFSYLPYDRVAGQWQGIVFHTSSYDNVLQYADIHSAYDAIIVDSSDLDKQTLLLDAVTIHNSQGYGFLALHSKCTLQNVLVDNSLYDCVMIDGGVADINNCTLAQFYPFDGRRGAAINFSAATWPLTLRVSNSLITGYADDVLLGTPGTSPEVFDFQFDNCIIRTPAITTDDSVRFARVVFEDVEDTVTTGRKHFVLLDTENFIYNFSLDSISPAINRANPLTALPTDRQGRRRDSLPDIGAIENIK